MSLCQEKQGQRQGKLNFNLCQTQHTENQAVGPYMHTCIHAHSIQNTYGDFGYIERARPAMNISQMGRSCIERQWDLRYRGLGWGSFSGFGEMWNHAESCASSSCHACPFLFYVFLVLILFPFFVCIVPSVLWTPKRWQEMTRDKKRWEEMRRDEERWEEIRRDEKRWDCTHLSHLSLFVSPVILFFAAFQPLLPEYGGSRQRKKKTGIRRRKQHWEKVQEARQCDLINLQLVFQSTSLLVALTLVVKSWCLV